MLPQTHRVSDLNLRRSELNPLLSLLFELLHQRLASWVVHQAGDPLFGFPLCGCELLNCSRSQVSVHPWFVADVLNHWDVDREKQNSVDFIQLLEPTAQPFFQQL